MVNKGFPGGASGEEPACQCRKHKRHRFDPCIRKMPWRRKWQPTPVFLPREFHGQRSLASYHLQCCKGQTWLSPHFLLLINWNIKTNTLGAVIMIDFETLEVKNTVTKPIKNLHITGVLINEKLLLSSTGKKESQYQILANT